MADTPKRKRLEKTSDPMPVSNQKFYCCRCGRSFSRQKGYFPVSHSPMYRGSGYLPFCNECIDWMYDNYRNELGDKEAMRRMCMKIDLYWDESIYKMAERSSGTNSRIRNYIGKTNIARYIDKTFDDTLREEAILEATNGANAGASPYLVGQYDIDANDENDEEEPIAQELIDFWGSGYTPDFYAELERRYTGWTDGISVVGPSERSLYRQICLLETIISRDAAQGKAIDKNVNALNSLLGSMNLKPAQKKDDSDASIDNTPLGVWIKRYEYKRPLPDIDPELKDVDGIIRYISVWFLGHLSKMLGIKNSYSKMYEEEIAMRRVKRPEYDDEDDEAFFNDIFGSGYDSGDIP